MDDKAYETARLNRIIEMIDRILCLDEQKRQELKEEIIEERERIWDDLSRGGYNPETDLQDTTVDSQADYLRSARVDFLEQRKNRLIMLRDNPYFARIDFKEKGEDVILLKPTTFMNNSGFALRQCLDFYKESTRY